jgi:hypothetical protein
MAHEALKAAAVAALAEYMGIAAEFVVDDAFDDVAKNNAFNKDPKLQEMYFFVCLGKLLPPEVPYAKLKIVIVKALAGKP